MKDITLPFALQHSLCFPVVPATTRAGGGTGGPCVSPSPGTIPVGFSWDAAANTAGGSSRPPPRRAASPRRWARACEGTRGSPGDSPPRVHWLKCARRSTCAGRGWQLVLALLGILVEKTARSWQHTGYNREEQLLCAGRLLLYSPAKPGTSFPQRVFLLMLFSLSTSQILLHYWMFESNVKATSHRIFEM